MLRPRRDPFTLLGFHRVLIATAILGCIGYGVRAFMLLDQGSSIIEVIVSWTIAAALGVYFWNIRHRR